MLREGLVTALCRHLLLLLLTLFLPTPIMAPPTHPQAQDWLDHLTHYTRKAKKR